MDGLAAHPALSAQVVPTNPAALTSSRCIGLQVRLYLLCIKLIMRWSLGAGFRSGRRMGWELPYFSLNRALRVAGSYDVAVGHAKASRDASAVRGNHIPAAPDIRTLAPGVRT
jgi:hypothetical protein